MTYAENSSMSCSSDSFSVEELLSCLLYVFCFSPVYDLFYSELSYLAPV